MLDYTKYVICEALGDVNLGFGMATFYGVNTLATLAFGREDVLKAMGRRGLMLMAFILQAIPSHNHNHNPNHNPITLTITL